MDCRRAENGYAIYSGGLGDLANPTGTNDICNRGLEYDFVTFQKRFIDVCGSIRCRFNLLTDAWRLPSNRLCEICVTECRTVAQSTAIATGALPVSISYFNYLRSKKRAPKAGVSESGPPEVTS